MPRYQDALSLGGHLVMGMVLGAVFALVLLLSVERSVLDLMFADSSPALVALFVGVFAMTFGVGAMLTGIVLDRSNQP
jgi:hypothetical protein